MSTELAALAADPDRIDSLRPEDIPALIGEAEALRAKLWAALQSQATSNRKAVGPALVRDAPDRLLTAAEAADRLGVDRRWIYRKADQLPFTRRLSAGTLRFSERGLERWQERQAA